MKLTKENLSMSELRYLEAVLVDGEAPTLEQMWSLMDDAWDECHCDVNVIDDRIGQFYAHPVWTLNGLFIEQHDVSMQHRRAFTEYVASLKPKRVADFGGGHGSLARMIAESCPGAEVHIVEPHPHAVAVALAEDAGNVRYVTEFEGEYDVIVATDVFEHVPDPLVLVERTAAHLRAGGQYLIANCFWPVIKCHLPATFHFRLTWDRAMTTMNLQPGQSVAYGRVYKKVGTVSASMARRLEERSRRWFWLIEKMPGRVRRRVTNLLVG